MTFPKSVLNKDIRLFIRMWIMTIIICDPFSMDSKDKEVLHAARTHFHVHYFTTVSRY
ncbi:protein of unknown function [Petrocella atlantisensis]|uniref:Uncharacterized protein n=1 Tax=Petrocella atlantisensis TaxID=2173034 RepID=A0A3P7PB60_9FIRM|nr:protein of unknown function [Petrocella atlantisensis]